MNNHMNMYIIFFLPWNIELRKVSHKVRLTSPRRFRLLAGINAKSIAKSSAKLHISLFLKSYNV